MKTIAIGAMIVGLLCGAYGQAAGEGERTFVMCEGKEFKKASAVAEAFLIGNIFEVTISARMYKEKPKVGNVLIVGPKLGRLSCTTREHVFAGSDEEVVCPVTDVESALVFGKQRTEERTTEGSLTKQILRFKIPREKIEPDKKYELWIYVETMKPGGRRPVKFIFELPDFSALVAAQP